MSTSKEKIEQYTLLAKGLRGAALNDLITKATSEPGLYTFGELLVLPQIQQLADTKHASALAILQLFAYGTLADYRANASACGPLSPPQLRKLQVLTVASLAVSQRILPYPKLQQALEIDTVRQLEDILITDCIYGGVVSGRLDQRSKCFRVEGALARDLPPEALAGIVDALTTWLDGARKVLRGIDTQVATVVTTTKAIEQERSKQEVEIERIKSDLRAAYDTRAAITAEMMATDDADVAAAMVEASFPLEGAEGRRPSGPRNTKRRR